MIKSRRRSAIIALAGLCIAALCAVGVFVNVQRVSASVGGVFDYTKTDYPVKYKAYQSDPTDSDSRKGLLLYAYDSGAKATFKSAFSGTFSADVAAAANEDASVETKRFSLLFTDVSTGSEFAVSVSNKASQKDVCVVYDGQKAGIHYHSGSAYEMYGLTGEYNAAGEYTVFSSQSAYIVFDPETMEVKLRLDDGVEHLVWCFANPYNDGKKLENDLPSFGEYTVSVVFDEIKPNSKGEIIIYSFGGYSFDVMQANFKPTVKANIVKNAVVGSSYEIPAAEVIHPTEGKLDATVSVEVYDASGNKLNDGNTFTPAAAGTYYVYYYYENNGTKASAYYSVKAIAADKISTEYYFDEELASENSIGLGVTMTIPKAIVENELFVSSAPKRALVTLYRNDRAVRNYENVLSGFDYTFTIAGEYKIVYSEPVDLGNWQVTKTFTVDVSAEVLGVTLSSEIPETVSYGSSFTLPSASMYINNQTLAASAELVFPSGKKSTASTQVLDETGTYTVTYTSGTHKHEVCFDVKKTYAGLFTNEADGTPGSYEDVLANNQTSGVKLSLRENEKYVYGKTLDLSDNVFDDNLTDRSENELLIEMYAQPRKVNSPDADALYIVLTDANDSTNYLEIRVKYIAYSNEGVYIRTRASGQTNWVGYNYDFYTTDLAVHYATQHEEGGFYEYFSMTHAFSKAFENMALRLYYDNQTKCLYGEPAWKYGHTPNGEDKSVITPWLIRDFKTTDSTLSQGNTPWNGFSTGEVILSVYAKGVSDSADFYITNIDGVRLSNEYIEPSAPVITVDTEGHSSAAYAVVGKPYKIMNYTVSDANSAIVSESVEVRRVESGVLGSALRVRNGSFTPNGAYTYAIVYKAVNAYGLESSETVYVQAKDSVDAPVLNVDTSALPETAVYGEEITLPTASASGGAGWTEIVYLVQNGGKTVEVTDGAFTCLGTGKFTVTIKAVDYVGQETSVTVDIDGVSVSTKPVFDSAKIIMPPAFIVGDAFTFAKYEANSYDESFNVSKIACKIEVTDGAGTTVLGADRKYTPARGSATDQAKIRFIFGEGENALTIEKTAPVLAISNGVGFMTKYFVGENVNVDADMNSINFTATDTSKDMAFSFVRPINVRSLNLRLSINDEKNNYDDITLILRDMYDSKAVAEITLRNDGELYASLNGGAKSSVTVNNKAVQIRYSSATKQFTDSLGVVLGTFEKGFSSGSVYMTVKVNGVHGASSVGVKNINNQTINQMSSDVQKPSISLLDIFEGRYAAGSRIVIPAAEAYDVLNGISDVTVKVTSQDETKVYVEERSATEAVSFTPDALGYYKATYFVKDNAGNKRTIEKIFSVYDSVKPSISFKTQMPQTVKAGSTLKLPEYVLADNYSTNDLIVRIYVFTPDGMSERVTGSSVTFATKGYYSINYMVMDTNNNIMTYTFNVRAE